MNDNGWIKLHRGLSEHWIWKDPVKLKWWIDILMSVNHEPCKVNIGVQLYDCGVGQSVMSLASWAERWGVCKDAARNYLRLLEQDHMITLENLTKTTRITVCKYVDYQVTLHDGQTQDKRKTNARPTQTRNNKENNIKESLEELPIEVSPKPKTKKSKEPKEVPAWKTDFDVYKQETLNAFRDLFKDPEFIGTISTNYPKADIRKSLNLAFVSYWGTEEGWAQKKKRKDTAVINWKSTMLKNFSKNIVNRSE